jgi:hypothetical protein
MKLPKSVKVGAWIYQIEQWDSTEAAGAERFGQCSTNNKTIKVDPLWGYKKAANTLLHEVVHAVYYEWNCQKDDPEERVVGCFSDGLTAVWHDNPGVMRWIGAGLRR